MKFSREREFFKIKIGRGLQRLCNLVTWHKDGSGGVPAVACSIVTVFCI